MGWKDGDEMTYEITDQDKEDYEKRIQHIPKVDYNSMIRLIILLSFCRPIKIQQH